MTLCLPDLRDLAAARRALQHLAARGSRHETRHDGARLCWRHSIQSGETRPIVGALQAERVVVNRLRVGAEAHALRHLFFAERHAM